MLLLAVTHKIVRPLLIVPACLLLASCLEFDKPVFTVDDAVAMPGMAGFWENQDGDGNRVLKTGAKTYEMRDADEAKDAEGAFENLMFIPLPAQPGYYLAQAEVLQKDKTRPASLVLFRLVDGDWLQYSSEPEGEDLATFGRKWGLVIGDYGHVQNRPGKAQVIHFFTQLVRHEPHPKLIGLLKRRGSFVDSAAKGVSVEAVQKAIGAKQFAQARTMLAQLADRGDVQAQVMLAETHVDARFGTPPDYAKAVSYAQDAWANGSRDGGLLLLSLYLAGPGAPAYGSLSRPGPRPDALRGLELAAAMENEPGRHGAVARDLLATFASLSCSQGASPSCATSAADAARARWKAGQVARNAERKLAADAGEKLAAAAAAEKDAATAVDEKLTPAPPMAP
ncbi:hypothetical protein DFR24_1569 [Panacagrimonas perspica]|uniref:Sel1 repeat-containing protein n=1 Tax=Panacagrimonas perspica TaxID=381431 RepID=A0A4R7PFN1_9GAMM|nr:hypothetical protein [Panacagrimonas perspica]TDU32180.1 hypothetical protein DFR24_1569 [Panacagrimonas perspica]THD01121.1 hypothetical protein B1810_21245 [Panacagrimonas perspica]